MTLSDQPAAPQPAHKLGALTTAELNTYRRELEHCLKYLPEQATVRDQIRAKLDLVLAEDAERERHRTSAGNWTAIKN